MGIELIELDGLNIAIWLHTSIDPPDCQWDEGVRRISDFVACKSGEVSGFRVLALSDGGAPSAMQRKRHHDALGNYYPVKVAVVTTVLRTSALKRGVATALHWLNPGYRFFEPTDILHALDHIDVPCTRFGPLWESFQLLQRSLPPNGVLLEIGGVLSLR
jgi:hypothetical protein